MHCDVIEFKLYINYLTVSAKWTISFCDILKVTHCAPFIQYSKNRGDPLCPTNLTRQIKSTLHENSVLANCYEKYDFSILLTYIYFVIECIPWWFVGKIDSYMKQIHPTSPLFFFKMDGMQMRNYSIFTTLRQERVNLIICIFSGSSKNLNEGNSKKHKVTLGAS